MPIHRVCPNGQQTRNLKQHVLPIEKKKHSPQELPPRRRDNRVQCWRGHRVAPPELANHFVCSLSLALFRHSGASETSRSEKLHDYSSAKVRSLQDQTNNRALGVLRKTKQFTLFLTWKSALRASENARVPKSEVECATRVVVLRVRCFAPANVPLLPRSALFSSAGSINSKPKTRFRPVFCCLVKTSGGACEREEAGKLSFFTFKRTHLGLVICF